MQFVAQIEAGQRTEIDVFAVRVAQRLGQCQRERRYEALHVIAAPRMLGYLRKAFDPGLAAIVVDELDKDLVQASEAELTQRLFPARDAKP